ncbi:MAG: DNA internalization-related competence protein ComEC/Rec2 [bacterium]|nr:DNA internalization-related competence protein ComEC/Rec2 [bacterium]
MAWASLHLGGVVAGGALPVPAPALLAAAPESWGRVTMLTPLLACGTGPGGALLAGAATFGLAGAWGWGEATARVARVDAVVADPWSPAVAVRLDGAALLRISGWSSPAAGGRWRAPARVLDFHVPGAAKASPCAAQPGDGVMLTGKGPAPPIGSLVACQLSLGRPRGAGIEGAFDYRRHLAGRRLAWTGRADSVTVIVPAGAGDIAGVVGSRWLDPLQRALTRTLSLVLPPRESSLGASVLLGARDADSRRTSQPFADLGLAHLFAVSGLHVGILLGLVLAPARAAGLGPVAAALPVFILLPPYAVLTGLPGSVIRAAGLGLLALLAPCLGRRFDPLRGLGVIYAATVAWEPTAALDIGLRLSYLAAGGILATSRATGGLRFCRRRPWAWLGSGLGVTLAAQWFTLPLAAQAFGRISLLAPAANLVAVPLFGSAVWMTVLGLALAPVWLPAGQACGALAWLQFRLLAAAVAWTAARAEAWDLGLPAMAPWQLAAWLMLGIALLWTLAALRRAGRPGRSLLVLGLSAPLGLLLVVAPSRVPGGRGDVVLTQFDVGQGDCGLLEFPDGWAVLLDTAGVYGGRGATEGPFQREVLPWLHRRGRGRFDAVVLTHGHRDHTGGAAAAAAELAVEHWYCGGKAAVALAGVVDPSLVTDQPDTVTLHRWRDWTATLVAAPAPQGAAVDENDRSLVLLLHQGRNLRLVWSGDLEEPGEERLLAAHPQLASADVWKAGHHGSDTSGGGPWLARLRPGLVLVSCGVGNRYRHPSHGPYVVAGDTLAMRRSDLHGTVTVRWDGRGRPRHASVWPGPATPAGWLP